MGNSFISLGCLVTFLVFLAGLSAASIMETSRSRRFVKRARARTIMREYLVIKRKLSPTTEVPLQSNVELSCEAQGGPSPTIHWLKDGHRIEQGGLIDNRNDEAYYEDTTDKAGRPLIRLSFTKSVLYLDNVMPEMEGVYECIADTTRERSSSRTELKIVSGQENPLEVESQVMKGFKDVPARQYLWTMHRVEMSGVTVQLFCRAEGSPKPETTWLDNNGADITVDNPNYEVLPNGDLLIKNLQWSQSGRYTCISENDFGRNEHKTSIYATRVDKI